MLDIVYRGCTSYELCHPLPVVNGNTVDLEFADKNAQLAAEFMRGVSGGGKSGSHHATRSRLGTQCCLP